MFCLLSEDNVFAFCLVGHQTKDLVKEVKMGGRNQNFSVFFSFIAYPSFSDICLHLFPEGTNATEG